MFKEIIDISKYDIGSGYDATWTESEQLIDTTENMEGIVSWLEDYFEADKDNDDVWYIITVKYYAEGTDLRYDKLVKTIEFTFNWEDDEFIVKILKVTE